MSENFNPEGPASASKGLYGLGHDPASAHFRIIPVPFEATTSYRRGTANGPKAVVEASVQVDLFDFDGGDVWQDGIAIVPERSEIAEANDRALAASDRAIKAQEDGQSASADDLKIVNDASEEVNALVRAEADAILDAGAFPAVLGGDHSSPYGLIEALAEREPGFGILHFDAHHDLRRAYEGFTWSHASIMDNVLSRLSGVARLVQVGVRDFAASERLRVEQSKGRIRAFYDSEVRQALFRGKPFDSIANLIVEALPDRVYVSFDIDGLDPKLCPNTGTPVPGGFDFEEAMHILRVVKRSGRKIIGFDLCEVAPGQDEWDAAVGARVLYKLLAFAR